jgi:hypothetical protein
MVTSAAECRNGRAWRRGGWCAPCTSGLLAWSLAHSALHPFCCRTCLRATERKRAFVKPSGGEIGLEVALEKKKKKRKWRILHLQFLNQESRSNKQFGFSNWPHTGRVSFFSLLFLFDFYFYFSFARRFFCLDIISCSFVSLQLSRVWNKVLWTSLCLLVTWSFSAFEFGCIISDAG